MLQFLPQMCRIHANVVQGPFKETGREPHGPFNVVFDGGPRELTDSLLLRILGPSRRRELCQLKSVRFPEQRRPVSHAADEPARVHVVEGSSSDINGCLICRQRLLPWACFQLQTSISSESGAK